MGFETKYRSNQDMVSSGQQTMFLYDDNSFSKFDEGFSFPDFQHLDHLNVPAYGSSSNSPEFGITSIHHHPQYCNTSMDPVDHAMNTYGSNPTTNINDLSFYESKPFADQSTSTYVYGGGYYGGVGDLGTFHGNGGLMFGQTQSSVRVGGIEMINTDMRRSPLGYYGSSHHEMVKPMNIVIPDEVSCTSSTMEKNNNNSENNAYYKSVGLNNYRSKTSTPTLTKRLCKGGRKKSSIVKGQWTLEEDRILVQLVEQYGVRKWSFIAQMLTGRIGKQCRERWHNHLRPNIKKETWSEEEDKILIRAHEEIGNKWAEIAKSLPGRTENNIKNHWNATKRRQFSRRKCRSKYPRQSSLLQNYIKSLNMRNPSMASTATKTKEANSSLVARADKAADPSPTLMSTNKHPMQFSHRTSTALDICTGNNNMVPDFDLDDVPDFPFDASIMFEDRCSIDSLLHDENVPATCAPAVNENSVDEDHHDEKSFEMEIDYQMMPLDEEHIGSLAKCEVKKEVDLLEMISQV